MPLLLEAVPKKSLHTLIDDFLGSTEFNQEIGARTQGIYATSLADIKANMADGPVKNIGRPDVLFIRDKMAKMWAPSRVNAAISTLRRLLNFSIDRGYGLAHNPALNIKRLKQGKGDGFAPWLPANIDLATANLTGIARTAFCIAYFTGQRSADILKMKWTDIAGDEVHVVQEKTGAEIWVPLHPDLQAELAVTERRGETIIAAELLRADGQGSATACQPLSKDAFRKYWERGRKRLGLNGTQFENTLHGLRKNATINLLEAGGTNSQVKAITGHSTDVMVNLYGKKVNQRRQAREAMEKVVRFDKAASENG